MKRHGWILAAVLVTVMLVPALAMAQQQRQRMGRVDLTGPVADVNGLWAYATFEAKLNDAALAKLKPVVEAAYNAKAVVVKEAQANADAWSAIENPTEEQRTAERAKRTELNGKLKAIGDKLVADAKAALGAEDAAKLQPWIAERDKAMAD